MLEVKVIQIQSGPTNEEPFEFAGKTQHPMSWVAKIEVGGVQETARLRTLSSKVSGSVRVGNIVYCNAGKAFQGVNEYKIITPNKENNYLNSDSKPPQVATEGAKSEIVISSNNSPRQRTIAEYEAMFEHAYAFAKRLLGADADEESLSRIMATYLIGAQREGISITSGAMNAPMERTVLDQIRSVVEANKLGERMDALGVFTEVALKRLFLEAGSEDAFLAKLKSEINKMEESHELQF